MVMKMWFIKAKIVLITITFLFLSVINDTGRGKKGRERCEFIAKLPRKDIKMVMNDKRHRSHKMLLQ